MFSFQKPGKQVVDPVVINRKLQKLTKSLREDSNAAWNRGLIQPLFRVGKQEFIYPNS